MGAPFYRSSTPQTEPAQAALSWYQAMLDALKTVPGGETLAGFLPQDTPEDLAMNLTGSMIAGPLAGPAVKGLSKVAGALRRIPNPIHPRVEVEHLGAGTLGGYQPASGRVMLDRDAIKTMDPAKRAEVVRHELAHKVETEGEVWKDTDTALWDLWEKERGHPIWDYMAEKTGRTKFDNTQAPEILAHLYAEDYPTGAFRVTDRPVPYAWESATEGPRQYPIPDALAQALDSIEAKLGIWGKKRARGTAP